MEVSSLALAQAGGPVSARLMKVLPVMWHRPAAITLMAGLLLLRCVERLVVQLRVRVPRASNDRSQAIQPPGRAASGR